MNKILKQLAAILVASVISMPLMAANKICTYADVQSGKAWQNQDTGQYYISGVAVTCPSTSTSKVSTHKTYQKATHTVSATVVDHYKTVVKQTPYDVEVCKRVRQGTGDGSATNEIIGAIFGGAIGNQFGEGDGKDAMTLAGIFLGASLAHDDEIANNQTGVITTKCYIETRYDEVVRKVYSHSTLTTKIRGKTHRFDFMK
jgi:uncharacterized protein YcfJ